jgi:predicted DNA-binding transcriptional regulator AlpA
VQSQLLTVRDVAKWLNVSQGWVFDHAGGRRRPLLPSIKIGKLTRFSEVDIAVWIETMSQQRAV